MVSNMEFEKFTDDIEKNKWKVFGVEVYENSVLTHSYGDTCDCIHEIYSATKSVLSVFEFLENRKHLIQFNFFLDLLAVQQESFLVFLT